LHGKTSLKIFLIYQPLLIIQHNAWKLLQDRVILIVFRKKTKHLRKEMELW